MDPLIEQLKSVITHTGGTLDKTEKWGIRKLAYRVLKHNEGQYILLQFTAKPDTVKELERRLRVADMVIKFITVRIDEKLKRIEKRKKAREKRAPASRHRLRHARMANHRLLPSEAPDRPRSSMLRAHLRPGARSAAPVQPENAEEAERKEESSMAEQRGGRPIAASQRPTGGDKAIATGKKQYFRRKKVCRFCVDKVDDINYKDVQAADELHLRARQDYAAPHFRRLHAAPEALKRGDQTGAQHRTGAVRLRM